ncbi:hypothetical protein BDF20DRAFT_880784 [Mycotypha africana]|uniref:uncharacterized protein n=1 Tax=Mycotypha africana TaxID=64632 RepID=UPI0022FFCFB1|nr:uncharacterized protein BDF20DRAFT_880784 [Mycotypha africana]KAI8975792.1 hypothetical protein BDF20DRAFT_880784 [Mycotypha africana]
MGKTTVTRKSNNKEIKPISAPVPSDSTVSPTTEPVEMQLERNPDVLNTPTLFGETTPIGSSTPIIVPPNAPEYITALFNMIQAQSSRLTQLEALVAENALLKAENDQLRKQLQQLQRSPTFNNDVDMAETSDPSRAPGDFTFKIPTNTPMGTKSSPSHILVRTPQGSQASKYANDDTPSTTSTPLPPPQMSPYQAAAHRGIKANSNKLAPPKVTTAARRAAVRLFQPASSNPGYQYIHLPCRVRHKLKELRAKLAAIHINPSRILDIQYPAKQTVSLLVHNDYAPIVKQRLTKAKVPILADFDPLSGTILHNTELAALPEAEKQAKAREFHTLRCLRALDFIRTPVAYAVAKTFLINTWITQEHIDQLRKGIPFFPSSSKDSQQSQTSQPPSTQLDDDTHINELAIDDVDMTQQSTTTDTTSPSGAGEPASQQ